MITTTKNTQSSSDWYFQAKKLYNYLLVKRYTVTYLSDKKII